MSTQERLEAENDALRRENLEMRRRLEALERENEEQKQRIAALQHSELVLQGFLDHTPAVMYVKDAEGRLILTNSEVDKFFGAPRGGMLGKSDFDYFPKAVAEEVCAFDRSVMASGRACQKEDAFPHPEGMRHYLTIKFPIYGIGAEGALGGVSIDITPIKQAEALRAAAQAEIIEAQQATIRELATPLLPIAEHALLLPIVGAVDEARAQRIIEQLLQAITEQGADTAIIDITGVRSVDAQVAEALVRAAQGVRLLGAKVVLTGIQPSIARTFVEMGVDLSGLATTGTLEEGIARALRRRGTTTRTKAD
ncbi:PAS domain-containing protein [Polyangium aurulentum]|uniref:PAS domain-containing protein n=1 Tax=Polyangium aurulentum TaxID=2567896 RepID=UPI0010AEB492|nr:PAS domain-containing protein [Polyangium aurulentum]UQA62612.1 PAS domain-containing protein [Polyangium aurulentum]